VTINYEFGNCELRLHDLVDRVCKETAPGGIVLMKRRLCLSCLANS